MPNPGEIRTAQFYMWDLLGSGRLIFPYPVDLEPPFIPFEAYSEVQVEQTFVDDLRQPTILERFGSFFSKSKSVEHTLKDFCPELPEPFAQTSEGPYEVFRIAVQQSDSCAYREIIGALETLIVSRAPISFEMFGNSEGITIQIAACAFDAERVRVLWEAYVDTPLVPIEDALAEFTYENSSLFEFCLQEEFVRPIATLDPKRLDPFTEAIAILESLKSTELGLVQVLFQGVLNPWAPSALIAVGDGAGGSFFVDEPNAPKLAQNKFASPLFSASIRCVAFANNEERRSRIGASIAQAILGASASPFNRLELGAHYETMPAQSERSLRDRTSLRLGMLLSALELASLVHLPFGIDSEVLYGAHRKTRAAPASVQGYEFWIGQNEHNGVSASVSLATEVRLKHTHVIGATGTGKSTFLEHCIVTDIEQNRGVIVLDPHGDLTDNVLRRIPEHRVEDVIVVNPSDLEYAVGFNVLDTKSEYERIVLSSDLVALFRRYATSWGDQMTSVLSNAVDAILERGGTLVDLQHFLSRPKFRDEWLRNVDSPRVKHFWTHDFKGLRKNSIAPLLTRLDLFLRPNVIRAMVGQKKGISIHSILEKKRILLVRLAHGLIGSENSYILGSLFVSKIHQAALARQALPKEERHPTFLYLDEFQHFLTPTLASILSESRKYGLGLILAHQGMYQLQGAGIDESIVANIGTRIAFQLGENDARKLEAAYAHFDRNDLLSLNVGEAISRVGRADHDFSLKTPAPKKHVSDAVAIHLKIIEESNAQHAKSSSVVLNELDKEYLVVTGTLRESEARSSTSSKARETTTKPPQQPPSSSNQELSTSEPHVPTDEAVEEIKKQDTKRSYDKQHQYLQGVIKKIAESRGFSVLLEEATTDGKGRIDLVLKRNEVVIAVEVARTTTDDHEVKNIVKCSKSGYEMIFLVAEDPKRIDRIKRLAGVDKNLIGAEVQFHTVGTLAQKLDAIVHPQTRSLKDYKGYRVKTQVHLGEQDSVFKGAKEIARLVAEANARQKRPKV